MTDNKILIEVLFTEQQIQERVEELGEQINLDYGDTPVIVIPVLKGSIPFAADLIRKLKMDTYLDVMEASSYGEGTDSTGTINIKRDVSLDISDKDVIVVEDIVDTGLTLTKIKELLELKGARSVKIAAMLSKPSRRLVPIDIDYLGFEIPDEFIVGYGLDYAQKYRNLPYIGILPREAYENK